MRNWSTMLIGGAAASLAMSAGHAQDAMQWRVEDGGNGHWYQLVPELLGWEDARIRAEELGGHLATITSDAESAFIVPIGEPNAWLGASAPPKQGCVLGEWSWVTGEPWDYSNWRPGEPGDCLETGLALHWIEYDGRWNNQNKVVKQMFVVEWSDDCNGDGIVDYGQILDGTLVDANGDFVPDCCQGGLGCGVEPVQWRVEDGGNGHWYAAMPCHEEWMGARQDAQAVGADLAVMPNEQTHQFLIDTFPPIEGYWIGGYQDPKAPDHGKPAGGWRWIGGEPIDLPAWCPGQPDNGVGAQHVLRLRFGCFDDIEEVQPCGGLIQSSLVEWSADCNGDGVVDYGQILDGTLVDADGDFVPDCCDAPDGCDGLPIQWRVEDGGNGHWYQAVNPSSLVSWYEARDQCEAVGGHLATFTSAEEHSFVYERLASNPMLWHGQKCNCIAVGPWIGLRRIDGEWTWVTDEPAAFFSWHPGEPWEDTHYVRFFSYATPAEPAPLWDNSTSGVDADDEFDRTSYLVEWSADCNGDGIVDYGQILDGTLVDADGDNVPDICQCTGDLNGNGVVEGADISVMLGFWGENPAPYPAADINADGIVNGADLAEMLGNWGPCK
jgi:hypothetical protein